METEARKTAHVRGEASAADWADEQVAAVRDDPAARIDARGAAATTARSARRPGTCRTGGPPCRSCAGSYGAVCWSRRTAERPGSPWWRAVNERLLRDGCEAVTLSGDRAGTASSRTVDYWLSFADHPTARSWYRAHNASVVAAYLEHRDLAEAENAAGALLHERRAVPGALHARPRRRAADVARMAPPPRRRSSATPDSG